MKTVDKHGTFEEAIAEASPEIQEIAWALRRLLLELYPDVTEVPWPTQQIIGYGIGPKKMSEHFGYIGAHGSHVNLGFNYGAELPDPEGLLEGTGKKLRHVKVRREEDVRLDGVRKLIEAAIQERENALGRER